MLFPSLRGGLSEIESAVAFPSTARASTSSPVHRRVLHVINGEHYSGAERVQDLLADGLAAEGFDIRFACIKPGKFPTARKSKATPLYELPMKSRLDVRVVLKMAEIVKRDKCVLIHAHTPRSVWVARAVASVTRIPLIYHVHSPTAADCTSWWRNSVNHCVEWLSLIGVDALIPVSDSLARHMKASGFSDRVIHTAANGVPSPPVRRDGTPPKFPWTLGTIALFRPRKGLEILLRALASLRSRGLSVRLRAIGPFETQAYRSQIDAQVEEFGLGDCIEWIGFTTDVSSQLARLDAFILPSLFGEGMPMVVLEAMAAGVPVIASRVEGVSEAIEDGVSGILVQPGDVSALADRIQTLVSGQVDWLQLRNNAIQRHSSKFSDHAMAARVAAVYRSVLDNSFIGKPTPGQYAQRGR